MVNIMRAAAASNVAAIEEDIDSDVFSTPQGVENTRFTFNKKLELIATGRPTTEDLQLGSRTK